MADIGKHLEVLIMSIVTALLLRYGIAGTVGETLLSRNSRKGPFFLFFFFWFIVIDPSHVDAPCFVEEEKGSPLIFKKGIRVDWHGGARPLLAAPHSATALNLRDL